MIAHCYNIIVVLTRTQMAVGFSGRAVVHLVRVLVAHAHMVLAPSEAVLFRTLETVVAVVQSGRRSHELYTKEQI